MLFRKNKDKIKTVTAKIDKDKAAQYELMGKQLADLYAAVDPKKGAFYRTAFIKGILTGVGGVIGATVVIAILLWARHSLKMCR